MAPFRWVRSDDERKPYIVGALKAKAGRGARKVTSVREIGEDRYMGRVFRRGVGKSFELMGVFTVTQAEVDAWPPREET